MYRAIPHFIRHLDGLFGQREGIVELWVDSGGNHGSVDPAIEQWLAIKLGAAVGNNDFVRCWAAIDGALISGTGVASGQYLVLDARNGNERIV
ncbi:hypothetical protein [Stenotrophomonas sp. ZAC14D2_NAIMI4_7]|uniref:hypothetical protein n=1 Tax=Stenotrophomonas sp. ZAC14D2_NAIMI4_7 TaxID=2072405 RepID=UPI001F3E2DCA|nr:hypothetical protein [Stenotrophomonas sp. ZAC14D2_NAIMI4_7]